MKTNKMEGKSSKYQKRSIDLKNPDETIILKQKNLEITSLADNPILTRNFFNAASRVSPEGPHHLICCQRNLVNVFSISAKEGIQLKSQISIPDSSNKAQTKNINDFKREFSFNQTVNKVNIVTRKLNQSTINFDFVQIDLNKIAENSLMKLVSKSVQISQYDPPIKVVILSTNSARIHDRNCLFEVSGFSTTQSFLTTNQTHSKPRVVFKTSNTNLKKIFFSEEKVISQQAKNLSSQTSPLNPWSQDSVSWSDLMKIHCSAQVKNLNKRLYCIEFELFQLVKIVKVYDRLKKKVLKVFRFVPGKILSEGLKANRIDPLGLKTFNTWSSNLDLQKDKLIFNGFFTSIEKTGVVQKKFDLIVANCILRKRGINYKIKVVDMSDQDKRKSCFGEAEYVVKNNKKEKINVIVKSSLNSPTKFSHGVELDKNGELAHGLTSILELGVMAKNNLIYLRDRRFMYLIDSVTSEIKQRARYSSFSRPLPYALSPNHQKSEEPEMLKHNMLTRFDPNLLRLEFIKINKNSISEAKDFNLIKNIQKKLIPKGLIFERIQAVKIGEAKAGHLSILTFILTKPMSPTQQIIRKWFSLISLDKDSLEVLSSALISREPLYEIEKSFFKDWMSNLIYDRTEGIWHFLDNPQIKDDGFLMGLLGGFNQGAQKEEGELLNHFWIVNSGRLYQEEIMLGSQVGKYLPYWTPNSGRISEERLYVKHKPSRLVEGHLEEILSAFVRSKVAGQSGFKYTKIGSLAVSGREAHAFVDDHDDLKIVVFRKQYKSQKTPEILIADSNLTLTHQLELEGMCGELNTSLLASKVLERSINGKRIIMTFFNSDLNSTHLKYIFLFDLVDGRMKMLRRSCIEFENQLIDPGTKAIERRRQRDDSFYISLMGPEFMLLDDYVYTFDV